MSILVVKASKPLADSKLGFTYSLTAGEACTVTAIKKDGLFGGTELRPGQELLLVNGSSTRVGLQDMGDLLKSLPKGTVTLIVREPAGGDAPSTADEATFQLARKCSVTKNKMLKILQHSRMKREINEMPPLLQERGVPEQDWCEIYTLIGRDLVAATDDFVTKKDRADLAKAQKPKAESHASRTDAHVEALHKSIVAQQKCLIAVSEVKSRVNAILAEFGLVASEVYEKLGEQKVATGLRFRAAAEKAAEAIETASEKKVAGADVEAVTEKVSEVELKAVAEKEAADAELKAPAEKKAAEASEVAVEASEAAEAKLEVADAEAVVEATSEIDHAMLDPEFLAVLAEA